MDTMADVWKEVLSICKNKVSDTMYTMWLEPLKLIKYENNTFIFIIGTEFKKTIILSKFADVIKESFEEVMGFPVDIDILVSQGAIEKKEDDEKKEVKQTGRTPFTFDNFVVGKSNTFAYSVSIGVAKNPGSLHNPLLIYGRSGLGKTHLLFAIENELKKNNPDMVVLYVTGESLMNELYEGAKVKNTIPFHQKYRNADALLVDDIQWIQRGEALQEEFFHTFDTLKRNGKQVVMTSDVPPREMPVLTERLRGRFEQGVIVDIQPPDFDTRKAIIINKCEQLDTVLSDKIVEFIAQKVKNNIRQIEGTVNKIAAMKAAYNKDVTLEEVQDIIKDITNDSQPISVTVEKITEYMSKAFGVTIADIKSEKRQANIALARQITIYVISEVFPDLTQQQIAEFFGKTRSNVNYSINQAILSMEKNPQTKVIANDAINEFQNGNA